MIRNYYYIARACFELNSILKDGIIYSAFTQEKNQLVFQIELNKKEFFLIASIDRNDPPILLTENFKRASKNTISFFDEFLPVKIINFAIAVGDRIIRLETSYGNFFFCFTGTNSNIIFQYEDTIEKFKTSIPDLNIPNDYFYNKDELINYIKSVDNISYSLIELPIKNIKKYFDGFSVLEIVQMILSGGISFRIEKNILTICPKTIADKDYNNVIYQSYFSAVDFCFKENYRITHFTELKHAIEKNLTNKIKYNQKKLNNLKSRIEKGSLEEEYKKNGDLILANIHLIKKGMNSIDLKDSFNNDALKKIPLQEKLSPYENAQLYYEKSKSEKKNFQFSEKSYQKTIDELTQLDKFQSEFFNISEYNSLKAFAVKIGMKIAKDNINTETKSPQFKEYLIEKKYRVLVGKDSKNNDYLTMKEARQNDYWFHARSVSGSHVVLKTNNNPDEIPKNILKCTASIAAFHSKAKTAGVVPVVYTLKKFVTKKKGMAPGQVIVLKENILHVNPEIPTNAEFISKEIKE